MAARTLTSLRSVFRVDGETLRDCIAMRMSVALLGFVGCLSLLPRAVEAFGTINGLGQNAEHEKITRMGLSGLGIEAKTMSEIAGKTGTFGAVGAPDNPIRGLSSQKQAHCDGGDFLAIPGYAHSAAQAQAQLEQCRQWVISHLNEAVSDAGAILDGGGNIRSSQIPTILSCTYNGSKGRAKCNVLEDLGLALHAAQDFYSHTNWSDSAAPGASSQRNPPGLNQVAPSPWLNPRLQPSFPPGLISGCYDGFPESSYCNEGPGGRVKHEYLNKDKGQIDPSTGVIGAGSTDRGRVNNNFSKAVRAAVADTRQQWTYFEGRLREVYPQRAKRILCAIKQDNPSNSSCPN